MSKENKIEDDTVETATDEDQFDTLDDAVEALGDDDEPVDKKTDPEDGESEDGESEDGEDFEDSDDNVLVTLSDGNEVKFGELKKGYFRNKDYTHKTEALSKERKEISELRDNYTENVQSIQGAYQNLAQFLETLIPDEPDIGLAQNDPASYQYQTALRKQVIAELQGLVNGAEQVSSVMQNASNDEIARIRSAEEVKLLEAIPALSDPERKAKFDADIKKVALDFGFTEQEVESTLDHRILQLAHYAKLGKIAENNRKNAGRRIAEKPRKGTRSNQAGNNLSKNRQAMKRLSETGTIESAMSVDFD